MAVIKVRHKTIIPSEAFAKITCRLVAGQKGDEVQDHVIKAIEDRCPEGVTLEVRRGCFANAYSIIRPINLSLLIVPIS